MQECALAQPCAAGELSSTWLFFDQVRKYHRRFADQLDAWISVPCARVIFPNIAPKTFHRSMTSKVCFALNQIISGTCYFLFGPIALRADISGVVGFEWFFSQ